MFWETDSQNALKTLWIWHVQYLPLHCPGILALLYPSRGPLCFTTQACPSRTSKPAAYCCAPCSSSILPSIHFFPLCVTSKSSWLVPYVVSLLMKRGRVVEDSEGEKWWHQRGGRLEKPVEIPSVKAEEVTENGKKNHVLHSMDRIPTLLCRGEKLLSKLYWLVLTLEVGDFKASSMQKLILTPFTISKYKGWDCSRGMNTPYCSESLSYQAQSWGSLPPCLPSPWLPTPNHSSPTSPKTSLSLVFSTIHLVLRPPPPLIRQSGDIQWKQGEYKLLSDSRPDPPPDSSPFSGKYAPNGGSQDDGKDNTADHDHDLLLLIIRRENYMRNSITARYTLTKGDRYS